MKKINQKRISASKGDGVKSFLKLLRLSALKLTGYSEKNVAEGKRKHIKAEPWKKRVIVIGTETMIKQAERKKKLCANINIFELKICTA